MSQHPSLRVDNVGSQHRNVLKRAERIKKMQEENRWNDASRPFGLPKLKSMKVKVKKVKEPKEAEAKVGVPAAPAAAGAKKPETAAAKKPETAAAPATKKADAKK